MKLDMNFANSPSPTRRFAFGFLALALLMATGIRAAGWFYFKHQRAEARHATEETKSGEGDD
jgi:hypothetical protein